MTGTSNPERVGPESRMEEGQLSRAENPASTHLVNGSPRYRLKAPKAQVDPVGTFTVKRKQVWKTLIFNFPYLTKRSAQADNQGGTANNSRPRTGVFLFAKKQSKT